MGQMADVERLMRNKLVVRATIAEILLSLSGAPSNQIAKLRADIDAIVEMYGVDST